MEVSEAEHVVSGSLGIHEGRVPGQVLSVCLSV